MATMTEKHVLLTVPFPDGLIERLQAVSPEIKLHVHPARKGEELPEEILADTEVLYTIRTLPDPEAVPNLRWIQFHFAGVDHVAGNPLLAQEILITTLSGAAVPQVAEFVLMSMLALGHRLPALMAAPPEKRWSEARYTRYQPLEMQGSTVGIVGYGSIGREVARLCASLGAEVLVAKRDLKTLSDEGYSVAGLGDPGAEIPKRIYPPEAVGSMLALCDFAAVTVPLTEDTRGLINAEVLHAMKAGAYLIDVSRGGVVDHGALVEGLKSGHVGGAALDVYPLEPLPESSPLWKLPNVILSPHIAGTSQHYYERAADLFAENLHRYLTERPLLNLYDPERGY
jgi:phosphoglycerate dehydrogenase-like enzyme